MCRLHSFTSPPVYAQNKYAKNGKGAGERSALSSAFARYVGMTLPWKRISVNRRILQENCGSAQKNSAY
ncbi:hypothetical protein SDC9_100043 [bioreactor metagenome]|uniref:Uncharacterized protein n=1 Tax=bioreactor metagenome TaxID=1076179 RepID=A0A645AK19_9ZZZZ